ncbi:MAG: glycosyltransferase [Acidimicrobiia bacterium]|nr:glycosyltransferase [Acidimicrobiia bacterium]
MSAPSVTILIPARNEETDIADALRAVLGQSYPLDEMEVVVVDGASDDRTAGIARELLSLSGIASWAVLENPLGTTPTSLNIGLEAARGRILCRIDARSRPRREYVEVCVDSLESRPDVIVVGGRQLSVARDSSASASGIARALNNRYSMGLSRYRRGAPSGPAETVYLGAFRTDELRRVGGWNEVFDTNQDFELNRRMAARGLVWFDERLVVEYIPRKDIRSLFRQYVRFGRWKVRYWRTTGDPPQPRQMAFLATLPIGLAVAAGAAAAGRRAVIALLLAGVTGAVVIEGAGSSGPDTSAIGRVHAVAAMGATSVGWLYGAWAELLKSRWAT